MSKTKKEKVEKVAKETGADVADLNRLPTDALDTIDAAIPDEDLLGSDDSDPMDTDAKKVFLGYHPISGAEVWK